MIKNRSHLHRLLGGACAKSAIRKVDDVHRVYGRYGWIEPIECDHEGVCFDVFVARVDDLSLGYGPKRLANLIAACRKAVPGIKVTELTGEAFFDVYSVADAVALFDVLGVRRPPKISDEAKARATARLHAARAAKQEAA